MLRREVGVLVGKVHDARAHPYNLLLLGRDHAVERFSEEEVIGEDMHILEGRHRFSMLLVVIKHEARLRQAAANESRHLCGIHHAAKRDGISQRTEIHRERRRTVNIQSIDEIHYSISRLRNDSRCLQIGIIRRIDSNSGQRRCYPISRFG